MSHEFDLLVIGRPSVDLMFSGLRTWPSIGMDIEADIEYFFAHCFI